MGATLERSDVTEVLLELYEERDVQEEVYTDAPFFGMLPKDTEAAGKSYKIGLIYGNPQGRSADASKIFGSGANKRAGKYAGFDLTYNDDYGAAAISGHVIDASRKDKGALVDHLKQEMDGALHQITRSAHHAVFRNGGGALGQISAGSDVTTGVVTLANIEDIVHFEVGQVLTAATTDGTSGSLETGKEEVAAVDRDLGTITSVSTDWDDVLTSLAAEDFLFVEGDFGAKLKGLDAWIPETPPDNTPFYSVDRSSDVVRLAGWRYDASAQPIVEALIDGVERGMRHGGKGERTLIAHPKQVARVAKVLQSQAMYEPAAAKSEDGVVSYAGIKVRTPKGHLDMFGDPNCQPNVVWCLIMKTWILASMGKLPKMLDADGLAILRESNADGVEARVVYRAGLGCKAPGWNGRIKVSA